MEVVCNANLPRPAQLVSLQAEKTVGKIFTERPSGSGASVPPGSRQRGSGSRIAWGLLKVLPGGNITEAEGGREALTSAVDDQQVTRRGLFGAFVVALEPRREQRQRCEKGGDVEHHHPASGTRLAASLHPRSLSPPKKVP